jgi:hypothetical protein
MMDPQVKNAIDELELFEIAAIKMDMLLGQLQKDRGAHLNQDALDALARAVSVAATLRINITTSLAHMEAERDA